MEYISVLFEMFLAVAGVVIAVIQLIGEIRMKKEEKKESLRREEEKVLIGKILADTQSAEKVITSLIDSYQSMIGSASKKTDNDPSQVIKIVDAFVEDFDKNVRSLVTGELKKLYDELIRNEEKFPMAYGYGRYISELREILDFDKVKRLLGRKGYDANRIYFSRMLQTVYANGGKLDKDTALKLGKCMEEIDKILEEVYLTMQVR